LLYSSYNNQDTRRRKDYNESHILTAKYAPRVGKKYGTSLVLCCYQSIERETSMLNSSCITTFQNEAGLFVVPYEAELQTKRHCIVYDSRTESLNEKGMEIFLSMWEVC
jgi:hypothetical protein